MQPCFWKLMGVFGASELPIILINLSFKIKMSYVSKSIFCDNVIVNEQKVLLQIASGKVHLLRKMPIWCVFLFSDACLQLIHIIGLPHTPFQNMKNCIHHRLHFSHIFRLNTEQMTTHLVYFAYQELNPICGLLGQFF